MMHDTFQSHFGNEKLKYCTLELATMVFDISDSGLELSYTIDFMIRFRRITKWSDVYV